jgi:diguanylate cyclase (GGDEF)-like protein
MDKIPRAVLGTVLAAIVLGSGMVPDKGLYFLASPILFIAPLRVASQAVAGWFLGVFVIGLLAGSIFFSRYPLLVVVPEISALILLAWVPMRQMAKHRNELEIFFGQETLKRKEMSDFQTAADAFRRNNLSNEKKLRQVEHLYDVIKEAGGTLNVQEMIELTREFTERMFDLPHFVLAVLSEDGKKYEVRISSGCDESAFQDFKIDLETNSLITLLNREKRPVYVPAIETGSPYSSLVNLTVHSFLLLPFLIQDRVIGFLCSFSREEGFLDQEKLSNLQVFGNQISIGLQKSLLYEKVQKLSITDGLTKLYSHRHFRERLQEELVLAGRYSSQLSLLILDIDHFKRYNDDYGHVAGDHVLMEVAKTLRDRSDASHLAARYGGEEMVLVAPETTKEQGMELAERIRAAVEGKRISVGKEVTQVKVSIGVATYPQDAQSGVDLIAKADQALYAAKAKGRNRVMAYPP